MAKITSWGVSDASLMPPDGAEEAVEAPVAAEVPAPKPARVSKARPAKVTGSGSLKLPASKAGG